MAHVSPPTTFNFADVWEHTVDRVPEREAVVCGTRRLTFAALDARADRFAAHLAANGVGPGDTVGIFAPNCTEWLEALLAAWKLHAVPFNVNHRYSSAELAELLDDSGAAALVFDEALADVVEGVGAERLGRLGTAVSVRIDDARRADAVPGTVAYDDIQAEHADARRPVVERSAEDTYLLYTGGTTGRPKGVLWRQEDAFFACFGGGDPMRANPVTEPEQLAGHIMEQPITYLCIAPLMHAAGQWVAMSWLWAGCRVVLHQGPLVPDAIWDVVDAEGANLMTVVGDAVGKPLLDAWDAHPGRWKATTLFSISNGGAPMSPSLKARLAATFPNAVIVDGFGSSETGAQGSQRLEAVPVPDGHDPDPSGATRTSGVAHFSPYGDSTAVLDEALERVVPGSGATGRVTRRGRIPIGYLNDPVRTAETFVEHDGERWVLTGDFASVEADGTINLLGRGSQCINTGGEKVFSEEVEMALQGHPDVADVVVIGVDDDRWGQAVCAVVQPNPGTSPDLEGLRQVGRRTLAGYKLPKHLVLVDEVRRSPAGKADYRWAREVGEQA